MMVMTKVLVAEAWQIRQEQGWWETFKWLEDHGINAHMVVSTQCPEEDRFTVYTPEGPVAAYTGDWIVILADNVGVYTPTAFEQVFDIPERDEL